jgi:hypothetical protein
MQFSEEFIERWEHLICEVDATEVPLECIKKIVVKLPNRRQKTINVQSLRHQGLEFDELEAVITRVLGEFEEINDLHFVVDVAAVAELVQPETDRLLGKL